MRFKSHLSPRAFGSVFLAIAILAVGPTQGIVHAQDNQKELDVTFHPQETPVWCWAATVAMIVGYINGDDLDDCEVLSAYDRFLQGPGDCCQGDRRCMRAGVESEMGTILGQIYGIHGQYVDRPVPFNQIVASIDRDKPLIAGLRNPMTGSGHVVVVSGYTANGYVCILDPIYGKYWASYQALLANWQYGIWNLTFTFN